MPRRYISRDGFNITAAARAAELVLITGGLSRVRASTVGLLLLLQPTLAFVWDVLFFDRPFGLRETIGALLRRFHVKSDEIRREIEGDQCAAAAAREDVRQYAL